MAERERSGVQLVTRGDDVALAESANDAVRECFENGILRNASVMAPAPTLDHAAARLADLDGLCVGLHVTLASEWEEPEWGPVLPASEVPSLVTDDGTFYRTPADLFGADPDFDAVVREMEAQLARLRDAGFDVTYADAHMAPESHSDRFAEAFAAFCEREGLIDGTDVPPLSEYKPDVDAEWLLEQLSGLAAGTYLVVAHPAYDDEEMRSVVGLGRARGEVGAARADQRQLFTDERVRSYVREHDIEVVRYDEL